jgi:hypothetical protein
MLGREIELTRVPGDRRVYAMGDVGTLRLEGLLMRTAIAAAGDATWRFARQGFSRRAIEASDSAGRTTGRFDPRDIRGGGHIRWGDGEYALRPHGLWRQRYVLADDTQELAVVEAKGWWGWGARRPVRLSLGSAAVEPGLLLFTAYVVRALADAASTNAGAASTAASTTATTT